MGPKRTRISRPRFTEVTVGVLLDASEITALRDEMQEWNDNLESANMEHLPKYDEVQECLSELDNEADELEHSVNALAEAVEKNPEGAAVLSITLRRHTLRLRASRADRLADCCEGIEAALKELTRAKLLPLDGEAPLGSAQTEMAELASTIRDSLGNLESVSFPGMF